VKIQDIRKEVRMKNIKITKFVYFINRKPKIKFLFFTKKGIELANFKFIIYSKGKHHRHFLIRLPGFYTQRHNNDFMIGTNNHYFIWHFYQKQLFKAKE